MAAVPPPPGVTPNFNAPNTLYKYNVLCQSLCLITTTLLVAIRVYTRTRILTGKSLRLDDYFCVIAWLMLIAYGVITSMVGLYYGGGQHIWDMPESLLEKNLQVNNITQIIYGPMIFFTKGAIILLYLNIFVPIYKSKTWWLIYSSLAFVLAFYIPVTLTKIFQCTPRPKIWNSKLPGKCINLNDLLLVTGSLNLITDVFLLLFPIYKIWSLKLHLKQQVALTFVFLLGTIAPIATALRLSISIRYGRNVDVTYHYYALLLWTTAETATGIVCACLPIMPAFFRHFYPKVVTHFSNGTAQDSKISRQKTHSFQKSPPDFNSGTTGYFELSDASRISHNITSTISGGGGFDNEIEHGIVKTARIFQIEEGRQ